MEEIGRGSGRGKVQDAEFTPVDDRGGTTGPTVVSSTPSPEDAYVILWGLGQRPRTMDALKQMVRLTDDGVEALLATLERAKLVAHGFRDSRPGVKVYAVTLIGRKLMHRALTQAAEQVRTEPAALPEPTAGPATPSTPTPRDPELKVPPSPQQGRPGKAVDVGGFSPQDVNPKAKTVPQGAYQAWSADILGDTANVHEIGAGGAQRETDERERIRKLLEAWKRQKRTGTR